MSDSKTFRHRGIILEEKYAGIVFFTRIIRHEICMKCKWILTRTYHGIRLTVNCHQEMGSLCYCRPIHAQADGNGEGRTLVEIVESDKQPAGRWQMVAGVVLHGVEEVARTKIVLAELSRRM